MARSLKKGPYIHYKLQKKVDIMNESGKNSVIKTWSRASTITPDFVNLTIAVYNGMKFIPVFVTMEFTHKYLYRTVERIEVTDTFSRCKA